MRAGLVGIIAAFGLALGLCLVAPAAAIAVPFEETPAQVTAALPRTLPPSDPETFAPRRVTTDTVGGAPVARLAPARLLLRPPVVPTADGIADAIKWAKRRRGTVSVAVIDSKGRLRAYSGNRQYTSASVVKAMLLVAYLRAHPTGGARGTLRQMIQYSDNDSARAVNRMVGDGGLYAVARAAKMKRYRSNGWWSLSQITAIDQARFFYNMDSLIPRKARPFARHVLSHITKSQSWGVPRVARRQGWTVFFKGGWRTSDRGGQIVHQAARLERKGQKIAIVVLTDNNPSMSYGIDTVEGVTRRVLAGSNAR